MKMINSIDLQLSRSLSVSQLAPPPVFGLPMETLHCRMWALDTNHIAAIYNGHSCVCASASGERKRPAAAVAAHTLRERLRSSTAKFNSTTLTERYNKS